jgi:superfamily II DNA or RNA helicase
MDGATAVAARRRTWGKLRYVTTGRGRWHALNVAPHVAIRLKAIFPQADGTRAGELKVADTPEVARDLDWFIQRYPFEVDEETRNRLDARVEQALMVEERVIDVLAGEWTSDVVRVPARVPFPYQLKAADLALTTGGLLCTDEVGLGKTFTSLLMLRAGDALPALVVTLAHLPKQWVEKELPKAYPNLTGHVVTSKTPYDLTEACGGRSPDVVAISYSKLAGWMEYLSGRVRTVIFDEVHELRHAGTDKYKAAQAIAVRARYRMGLSGTPVFNYGIEVFNLVEVLSPGLLGERAEFLREWCEDASGKYAVKDPAALGEYLRSRGVMLGHTCEEVGRPLPKTEMLVQPVDADAEVFDKVAGDAAEIARFILNKAGTRNQQFAYEAQLNSKVRQATGIAKAPFVAEFTRLLLEAGRPRILLLGWHRAVYDIWRERLEQYGVVDYTGEQTEKQKARAVEAFLGDDARVLMMSLRSGVGLDGLQMGCRTVVFGELDWSPQVHAQDIGRLRRPGMTEPVEAYFCASEYGTDPAMTKLLDLKRMQNDLLLNPHAARVEPAHPTASNIELLCQSLLEQEAALQVA